VILPVDALNDGTPVFAAVCHNCNRNAPLALDEFAAQWNADDAEWLTWPDLDGTEEHECPACVLTGLSESEPLAWEAPMFRASDFLVEV
jgi:hypothetical protein